MENLNRKSAPQAKQYTERIIQFGEGNFLRAFIDWIIWNTNQKTDFDASVVVVQPIDRGMVDMLNAQDCLYHLNLQGLDAGEPVAVFQFPSSPPLSNFSSTFATPDPPVLSLALPFSENVGLSVLPVASCTFMLLTVGA